MAAGRRPRVPQRQADASAGKSGAAATPWDDHDLAALEAQADEEEVPFWRRKALSEMTANEWESLCDGCGRCCLVKLEEEETGNIYFTDVGCRMLDTEGCRCRDYANRSEAIHDCVQLTPAVVDEIGWLPPTCGYRLIADGKDLYWWHPLVSGDPDTVHQAGVSVRGRVKDLEDDVSPEALDDRVVNWPLRWPKRARVYPVKPRRRSVKLHPIPSLRIVSAGTGARPMSGGQVGRWKSFPVPLRHGMLAGRAGDPGARSTLSRPPPPDSRTPVTYGHARLP